MKRRELSQLYLEALEWKAQNNKMAISIKINSTIVLN